ncbi:MAG: hypothetical protein SFU56_07625 [Capsulimonadales bacterium]|nr:hypothetical protein [Capsulimonadales bacterium]
MRKYPIQLSAGDFETGILPNGNQLLIGKQIPGLIAVLFSPDGDFIQLLTKPGSRPLSVPYRTYELESDLMHWQKELQVIPHAIGVRKFMIREHTIGIQDIPDHLTVTAIESLTDEDDRIAMKNELACWKKNRCFVLWWAKDYYMNRRGGIDST